MRTAYSFYKHTTHIRHTGELARLFNTNKLYVWRDVKFTGQGHGGEVGSFFHPNTVPNLLPSSGSLLWATKTIRQALYSMKSTARSVVACMIEELRVGWGEEQVLIKYLLYY